LPLGYCGKRESETVSGKKSLEEARTRKKGLEDHTKEEEVTRNCQNP